MAFELFKIRVDNRRVRDHNPELDSLSLISIKVGGSAGTTVTNSNVVVTDNAVVLTNKTIDASSNTISNIRDINVNGSAAIAESKLALDYSTLGLNDAIVSEASSRGAQDLVLQGNIDAEASARSAAILGEASARGVAILGEASARGAQDLVLQGNIDAEASARSAKDIELQGDIDGLDGNGLVWAGAAGETALNVNVDNATIELFGDALRVKASGLSNIHIAAGANIAESKIDGLVTDLSNKLALAGGTMSGTIAMGLNNITSSYLPLNGVDLVNKNYVDNQLSGLYWKKPVLDIVAAVSSGASVGDRYLLNAGADVNKIAMWNGATWDYEAPLANYAVFESVDDSAWTYDAEAVASFKWVQFTGAGQVVPGVGLGKNGNMLYVKLGAGVGELPTGEVGLDLSALSGLELTPAGSGGQLQLADSVAGTALSINSKVIDVMYDDSTISLNLSGELKVKGSGLYNAQINGGAAIEESKLALAYTTTDLKGQIDALGGASTALLVNDEVGASAVGEVYFLNVDGKAKKAAAGTANIYKKKILVASAIIPAGSAGKFIVKRNEVVAAGSGLAIGEEVFLASAAGAITQNVALLASGEEVLVVGYARSATSWEYDPRDIGLAL